MIDLYFWSTPNVYKVLLFLEEAQLPYRLVPVDIQRGDQHSDSFRRINPNGRVPAIVDRNGPDGGAMTVFESGAILQYLARKTGTFHGRSPRESAQVDQWLFWQMAGLGPMVGQNHHFHHYAKGRNAYAKSRYMRETTRLYQVLEQRLAGRLFIAGDVYTIADMACYPWIRLHQRSGQAIDEFECVKQWLQRIASRPATARTYQVTLAAADAGIASDRKLPA